MTSQTLFNTVKPFLFVFWKWTNSVALEVDLENALVRKQSWVYVVIQEHYTTFSRPLTPSASPHRNADQNHFVIQALQLLHLHLLCTSWKKYLDFLHVSITGRDNLSNASRWHTACYHQEESCSMPSDYKSHPGCGFSHIFF